MNGRRLRKIGNNGTQTESSSGSELEEWKVLKGKGRGKKLLLGEKRVTPRPVRPPADMAEDSEVSSIILQPLSNPLTVM